MDSLKQVAEHLSKMCNMLEKHVQDNPVTVKITSSDIECWATVTRIMDEIQINLHSKPQDVMEKPVYVSPDTTIVVLTKKEDVRNG